MSEDIKTTTPELQPDSEIEQRVKNNEAFYELALAHKQHGFLFRCRESATSTKSFLFVVLPGDEFPAAITPDAVPAEWRVLNRRERNKFKGTKNRIIQ